MHFGLFTRSATKNRITHYWGFPFVIANAIRFSDKSVVIVANMISLYCHAVFCASQSDVWALQMYTIFQIGA